jgi:hypothetical protein
MERRGGPKFISVKTSPEASIPLCCHCRRVGALGEWVKYVVTLSTLRGKFQVDFMAFCALVAY